MPLREQIRIKADTVAEECTCPGPAGTPHDAKCPSLQPDRAAKEAPPRALMFTAESEARLATEVEEERRRYPEPAWCKEFDARHAIQAPAPEPSAPPAGVPVCPRGFYWCGVAPCDNARCEELHDHRCQNCRTNGRPISPPPSDPVKPGDVTAWRCSKCHGTEDEHDARGGLCSPPSTPVTVATGVPVAAHPAPFAHYCDIVPDDDDDVTTAEECAETVRRLGIDVPAWAADIRARVAAVATGGVPAGYRLGEGWVVDRTYLCSCTGCRPNTSTEYYKPRSCGKGACSAHAVLMGALVPIDTGTATDTGGEAQADAIKAAVSAANDRAADAFRAWRRDAFERTYSTPYGRMNVDQFEAWLRSGEDAPGAVGK